MAHGAEVNCRQGGLLRGAVTQRLVGLVELAEHGRVLGENLSMALHSGHELEGIDDVDSAPEGVGGLVVGFQSRAGLTKLKIVAGRIDVVVGKLPLEDRFSLLRFRLGLGEPAARIVENRLLRVEAVGPISFASHKAIDSLQCFVKQSLGL